MDILKFGRNKKFEFTFDFTKKNFSLRTLNFIHITGKFINQWPHDQVHMPSVHYIDTYI